MSALRHIFFGTLVVIAGTSCGPDNGRSQTSLISDCQPIDVSENLFIGIGKDQLASDNSTSALIVGGYQGGHHLWGALRLLGPHSIENIQSLHFAICKDDEIIGEAKYGSTNSLSTDGQTIFGIPVVLSTNVGVASLEGRTIRLIGAIREGGELLMSERSYTLDCCGHVADGD